MNAATGFVVLLAGLLSAVTAGPLNQKETHCASTCKDDNKKFGYEIGQTYIYSYEAKAQTTVPGTTRQETELYLRTRVKIEVLSKCNLVLRLLDVSLENSSPTNNWRKTVVPNAKDFVQALQAYSLPFSFQDGLIEHICASHDEPAWVLNVKRGILSVLQNNMENLENDQLVEETDVSGNCKADYRVAERGWSATTLKKTKDLLGCKDRHSHQSALQSLPYESSSPVQSLPILKSTHECVHTIKSKRIEFARCEEQHVFRPFSSGKDGVTTTIVQLLTYEREETAHYKPSGLSFVRSSLLFDHSYKHSANTDEKEEAERTLSRLCIAAQDDIRPNVPALFSKLVQKLRSLQRNQLQVMFRNVDTICNGNKKSRTFFLDGLQMTFTDDAIEFVTYLITQKEISEIEADVWLLSTAFVPHPTKSMIISLLKLIEMTSPRQKAVLGLSAMIHTYCQQHECETDPDLQSVIGKFLGKLDTKCNIRDDKDQVNTILVLKAIGNMGFGKTTVPHLERCYKEKENPVEVRIRAIEALRRMPCGTQYADLLHIFGDGQEDTEVRIAAYLLLMKCPTRENIHIIKDLLNKEDLNQVYSFVWTHLTNMQESVDPCKKDVRDLLEDQVLKRKFSTDSRKFSKAFEGSLYSEALNTGVHTEGSIIFSQKSFLPRSAALNLTIDLFGSSLNLFEVGGRVEGLEHLVESFFGPNGYYPEKTIGKLLRNMRGKRSVDDSKLTAMEQKFRARSGFGDHPKGSMFLRVFGNDLHYTSFDGLGNQDSSEFFDFFQTMFSQEEVDITKSFTFLDSSFITPTSMGLPLNLTLNGTAVVTVQMKGHLDLGKIANMNCDVSGYIKPSAAVQVTGTMAMDAFIMQTGLKVKATLHTSTALSGNVQLRRGELVNVQIDAPKEKMEIININTEILLLTGDKEVVQEGIAQNKADIKHCSGRLTTQPLGFEICTELKYPNASLVTGAPYFPLTGPAEASIFLRKTDPSLSHYVFEYRWQNEKKGYSDQYVRTRRLSFNTPGSTVDRDFTAEVITSEPEHSIRAALRTPFKKIGLNGKYSYDVDIKKVDGSFSIDDEEKGIIYAALQVERNQGVLRLLPSFYVRASNSPLVSLKGYTTIHKGKKIGVDLTLEHVTTKPISIQGEISRTLQAGGNRYEANTKLKSHLLNGSVKGHIALGDKQHTSALTVEYSVEGRPKKQYDISTKYRDNSSHSGLKYSASVEMQGSDIIPFLLDWNLHTSDNKKDCSLEFSRGSGQNIKKISLTQSLLHEDHGHMQQIMAQMRASCPACGIELGLKADHQYNDSALNSQITVEQDNGRKVSIQLDAYRTMNVLLNIGTTLNFNYPGHDAKFSANLQKPSRDEIHGSFNAEAPGKKLAGRVNYRADRNHPDSPGHEVMAEFRLPNKHPIVFKGDIRSGKHPSASAEYEYEQNNYALSADYDHIPGIDHKLKAFLALPKIRYDAEGFLSIEPHYSRFSANLHMNKKQRLYFEAKYDHQSKALSGSADIKWETDSHSGKRAFIAFDIKRPDVGYEFTATVKCPQHSTHIEFITKTEGKPSSPSFTHTTKGEFRWDQNKIGASLDINQVRRGSQTELYIEAGVDFPQIGLYKPSFSYSHFLLDNEINFEVKFQHKSDVYVLTSQNHVKQFSNFESKIKFVQPNKEPVQLTANYQRSDRQCTIKIQSNDFELLISGENKGGRDNLHFIGTGMVTTGDTYSMSYEYKTENSKVTTTLSAKYNFKTWKAVIEVDLNRDESKTGMVGTVTLTKQTPENDMSTTSFLARYSNNGSNLSSFLEIIWDQVDRFAIEVVGSRHQHHRKINLAGSVHVVNTFSPLKDILVIGSHERVSGHCKNNIEAKWGDKKTATFKLDVTATSVNNVNLFILLTTSTDIVNHLSLSIHHSITDKFETTLKVIHNDNTMSLDIDGLLVNSSAKQSIAGTVCLRTSSKQLQEVKAAFSHVRSEEEFTDRVQLSWGESTTTISHNGVYKDWLNFYNSISIKTPYKGFAVIAANVTQLNSNDGFSHHSLFDTGSDNKYQLTVDSRGKEQSNGFKQQVNINVITPKRTYGPYNVETTWKMENGDGIFTCTFALPTGQRLEVSGATSFDEKFGKGTVKLATPFAGWNNMILSGMYNVNGIPAKVNVALQWSPEHKIELESTINFTDNIGGVQLTITTPFEEYKIIRLGGQYNVDYHYQLHNFFFSVEDKNFEIKLVSSIDDEFKVITALTIRTPIRGWEKLHAEYCLQVLKGYAHVDVTRNDDQIKCIVLFHFVGTTGEIGFQLFTPFSGYQILKTVLNYTFGENLNIFLQKENISANLSISINIQPKKLDFTSKLTSTHFNFDYGIEGTWYTEGPKSSMKAEANFNADRISIQGSVTIPDDDMTATLSLRTPFSRLRILDGTFKIDHTPNECIVTVRTQLESSKLEMVATWALLLENTHASLSLTAPFLQDVFFSAQYDLSTPSKTAVIVVSYGTESAKLSANIAREYTRFEGLARLKINSDFGNSDYSITFSEDLATSPKYTTLTIKANEHFLKTMCTFEINNSQRQKNGQFNVVIDSSLFEHQNNGFEITYDFALNKSINFVGTISNKKIELNIKDEGVKKTASIDFDFSIIENYQTMRVTAVYKSQESENNIFITMKNDNELSELSGNLLIKNGKQELKLASNSSHTFSSALEVITGFDISGSEKSIVFTVSNRDNKIDVRSIIRYDDSKAIATVFMTTSHPDYESILLQGIFDVSQPTKTVKFTMQRGDDSSEATIVTSGNHHRGEVTFDLITPYNGYRDISFLAQYSLTKEKSVMVAYHWAKEKEIKVNLKLMNSLMMGDVKLTVTTPFKNYEKYDVLARFNLRGPEKNVEFSIACSNEKATEFSIYLQNERDTSQLKVNIITPFKHYTHYQLTADYDSSQTEESAHIVFVWANKIWKEARFNYRGNRGMRNLIYLKLDPADQNRDLVEFKLNYDFSTGEKKATGVGTLFGDTTKFTGSISTDQQTIEAIFESPYSGYEVITLVGDIPSTTRERMGTLNGKWNSQTMNLNYVCKHSCVTNNDVKFSLSSELKGWENVKANLKYNFASQENYELHWSTQKNKNWAKFIHNSQFLPHRTNVTFAFTSSISQMPILLASFELEHSVRKVSTKLSLQFSEDKNIILSGNIDCTKDLVAIAKMTTPFPNFELAEFIIQYNIEGSEVTGSILGSKGSKRIELTGFINHEPEHGSMNILLNTPFTEPASVSGNYDLKKKEQNIFLIFQLGKKKIAMRGSLNTGSMSSTAKISISTPFQKLNTIDLDLELFLNQRQKHIEVTVNFPEDIKIQFTGGFESHGYNYISSNFTLKSPFSGFESFDMKSLFSSENEEYRGLLAVRWSPDNYLRFAAFLHRMAILFTFDSPQENIKLSGTIICKHGIFHSAGNLERKGENIVSFAADIKHDFWNMFDGSAKFLTIWHKIPELSIAASYKVENGFRAQLDVRSPFQPLNSIHAECVYEHKGLINHEVFILLELPNDRLQISFLHQSSEMSFNLGFKVVSTFPDIPNTEFKVQSKFRDLMWFDAPIAAEISLTLPNSKHGLSYSLEISQSQLEGLLNIDSIWINGNTLSSHISGTYDKQRAEFSGSINIPTDTYSISGDVQYNDQTINGKLKINDNINVNVDCDTMKKEFTATVSTKNMKHHISGSYQVKDSIRADISVDTPLMDVKSISLRFSPRSESVDGQTSMSTNSATHSIQFSAKWTQTTTAWYATAQTPLFGLNKITLEGKIISGVHKRQLEISLKTEKANHNLVGSVDTEGNVVVAQISVDTPILNINTWTVSIRISNSRMKNVSAELSLVTSTTLHTLSYIIINGENRLQFQIKLKTPLFNINSVSLNGVYAKEYEKTEFSMILKLPYSSHSLSIRTVNLPTSYVGEFKIETLLFNINTVGFSLKVPKIFFGDFEASMILELSKKTHTLEMTLMKNNDVLETNMQIQTPAFRIGYVVFNAKMIQQGWLNTETWASLETNHSKHSVYLNLQKYSTSAVGQLKLDLPVLNIKGFHVTVKILQNNEKGHLMEMIVLTDKHQHKAEAGLHRMADKVSSSLLLDSSLVEPIRINIKSSSRCAEACGFDMEIKSGKQDIKMNGSLKRQSTGIESSFNIDTTFEHLKNIRGSVYYKVDRSSVLQVGAEVHTSNPSFDVFRAKATFQSKHRDYELTVDAQTPFESIKTIKLEGKVSFRQMTDMTDLSTYFKLTIPKGTYIINSQLHKSWYQFSISTELEWNSKKAELAVAAVYEPVNWEGHVKVGTPFMKTVTVDVKASNDRGSLSKKWQSILEHGSERYAVNFDHTPEKGKLDVILPSYGHESTSVAYSKRRHDNNGREYLIEFAKGAKIRASLTVQANLKDIRIQAKSPLYGYEVLTIYFVSKDNGFQSEMKLNDQSIFEVGYHTKEGQHVVLVTTPSRPMRASFSRSTTMEGWVVKGEFCYNLNHKSDSTYGLQVEKKRLDEGYSMIIKAQQKQRILILSAQTQKFSSRYHHKTEFTWDKTNSRGLEYEINIVDGSTYNKIQHDATVAFRYVTSTYELNTHHEQTQRDLVNSADFKWGTHKSNDKHLGTRIEYHNLSNGPKHNHKAKLTLTHHKLAKDLVLRGEMESHIGQELLKLKTEVEYSHDQNEHLNFELKLKEDTRNLYNAVLSLKHPKSNLDLQLEAELSLHLSEIVSRLNFVYLDRFGKLHTETMQATILLREKEIELQIKFLDLSLILKGYIELTENQSVITLQGTFNNQLPVTAKMQIDRGLPNVIMEVMYNPENQRYFTLSAGMPTQKLIKLEANHVRTDGRKVRDVLFVLQLNNSRVLDFRASWEMPSMLDAINIMADTVTASKQNWQTMSIELANFAKEELKDKLSLVCFSVAINMRPLLQDLNTVSKIVETNTKFVIECSKEMYRENQFFSRDILDGFRHICSELNIDFNRYVDGISNAFHRISQAAKIALHKFGDVIPNFFEYMDNAIQEWRTSVHRWTQDSREAVRSLHRHAANALIDILCHIHDKVRPLVNHLSPAVKRYIERICDRVQNMIDATADYMADLMAKGRKLPGVTYIMDMLADLAPDDEAMKTINEYYDAVVDKYTEAIENGAEAFNQWSASPQIEFVTDMAKDAYQKASWAYDYWKVEENVKTVVLRFYNNARDFLLDLTHDLALEYPYVSIDASHVTEFNPDKGYFRHTQQLPVEWLNFRELPDITQSSEVQTIMDWKDHAIAQLKKISFWDTYNKHKSKFSMSHLLPHFESYAMLAGNQHYMTFDKRYFEFSGKCSYLLAHDFVDRNFTAIVNYEGDDGSVRRKSLFLMFKENKLEVSADFTVTLNTKKTELPIQIDDITVTREHSAIIVHTTNGVQVTCNFGIDVCIVKMSGWYFGKTGGMFGTYDNEPKNDFVTPDRKHVDDIAQFASSWEVGSKRCRTITNSAVQNEKQAKVCTNFFKNSESPLRSCFHKVNPDDFNTVCNNDVNDYSSSSNKSRSVQLACNSVAYYVTRCNLEGATIKMPDICVTCNLPAKGILQAGEEVTLKKSAIPRSADVVFIVEEKLCNKNIKLLQELVKGIEAELHTQNVNHNRYALIGYGGDGVHDFPHIHTANGEIFSNEQAIVSQAFSSLQTGNGNTDLLVAIRKGAQLSYRAGVSKNVLVLPCSDSMHYSTAEYDIVHHMLKKQNIKLHVFSPSALATKSPFRERRREVIGIDGNSAYTLKDVKDRDVKGDANLRNEVVIPETLPVSLALHSNGSVFSRPPTNANAKVIKTIQEVFARRLALTTSPPQCQKCHCMSDMFGEGQAICAPCDPHGRQKYSPENQEFYKKLRDYTERAIHQGFAKARSGLNGGGA